jgi:hypothetical protein
VTTTAPLVILLLYEKLDHAFWPAKMRVKTPRGTLACVPRVCCLVSVFTYFFFAAFFAAFLAGFLAAFFVAMVSILPCAATQLLQLRNV